jgi:valyl-tRNA synthetase
MNLENSKQLTDNSKQIEPKTNADKKILNQLDKLITSTEKDINDFNFGAATQNLYHFFWNEFCDKYLEVSKTQMQDKKLKENTQKILFYVLTNSLQLLHPFIPFVTEEIWKNLGFEKPLIISDWPKID